MKTDSRSFASDLQRLFEFGTLTGLTDGELLDRLAARQGLGARLPEAAFEILVSRHGSMVLRVCRLYLNEPSDVDDAFQATFLVFARRLGSIRRRESVASWLHGVAARVAARARVEAARRRFERTSDAAQSELVSTSPNAFEAFERDETGTMVEREVRGLPTRYREVIVLCFWEGLTQEEAAARLGCPVGTVRSRSARARNLLKARLVRRGLAPLSAMAAGIGAQEATAGLAALPRVSVALTNSTIRGCVAILSGAPARQVASGSVFLLTQYAVRSAVMLKLKAVVLGSAMIGLGFLASGRGEQKRGQVENEARQILDKGGPRSSKLSEISTKDRSGRPKADSSFADDYIIEAPDVIDVEVLDALPGRPITGERQVRPDGKVSLGFYGELIVAGLTIPQAKEAVIMHLRTYLADDVLGLEDEDTPPRKFEARDSDRVFVNVAKSNSKFYYLQGEVAVPGRVPLKGNETVLDAINVAGGLTSSADRKEAFLIRKPAKGMPPEKLSVNLEEVMMGSDPTTNYALKPGDRLVVRRDRALASQEQENKSQSDALDTLRSLDRRVNEVDSRLKDLDRKLDRVLEKLAK